MYNVAPYVERCLRSLEDQNIPKNEYEIICINDGSPDNCKEVVEGLQTEFDNIILINQQNQGVSAARNNGIEKACGTYLLFIDPDDFVDSNCFDRILRRVDEKKAQVSFLGYTVLNEKGVVCYQDLYEKYASDIYQGVEAYFLARGQGHFDPDRMVATLFNNEFLCRNKLKYLTDVPYLEDGELISRIMCLAESCIFDGYSFYQRTTRHGSATHSRLFHSEKATKGFIRAASNLKSFQQNENLDKRQQKFLNQPIVKFVILAINSSIGQKHNKKLVATVSDLRLKGFRKIKLNDCNRIYRFLGRSYNFSPYLCALVLILYPRINGAYIANVMKKIFFRK